MFRSPARATITTARLRMTSRALLGASSISRRSRSSKWEVWKLITRRACEPS